MRHNLSKFKYKLLREELLGVFVTHVYTSGRAAGHVDGDRYSTQRKFIDASQPCAKEIFLHAAMKLLIFQLQNKQSYSNQLFSNI